MNKNKYKVVVYTISKNEEKFAERWAKSMNEADEVYVLDTGSTDNTVNILKENGVNVRQEIIDPWRFDVARNKSLDMVPLDTDICICTDLDEVFETGWRKKLEELWINCDRVRYHYNWQFNDKGNPIISYYLNKIHTRNNYIWYYPVHEILKYTGNKPERIITTDEIVLNQYSDKEKSRNSYLPLLELAAKENPNDDRCIHYLGREYMYYERNDEAIEMLKKHLELENSTWKDERSTSMRFIARCYKRKNELKEAKKWFDKSIKEAPYLRDPYVEKALLMYELKDYNNVIYLCNKALDIKNNKTYVNESFSYDHTIYDLLSLCYYFKNDKYLALYYINKALEISPNIERLQNNKTYFEKMKEE